jgi:ATP-binding cassette subfamily B multidrug efflux pump
MSEEGRVNYSIFKRLITYAKPYKKFFFIALTCVLLIAASSVFRPLLIADMVQNYIIENQDGNALLFWSTVVIGMLLFEAIFQFTSSYFSNLLAQNIIADMRKKLFAHITTFRMKYFDRTPIGSLVTRVVADMEAISEVFSTGLVDVLGDIVTLVAVVLAMFYVDWNLTLLVLIPIPLLILATKIFARSMNKSFQQERLQVTRLNNFVQERISGMAIVQLFNREQQEFESFKEINKAHRKAHINAIWAFSIFFPVVEILSSLSIAFLLVFIAFKVEGLSGKDMTSQYQEVIKFTFWINMLFRPIRQLADKFNILQRGTVRAERVFEILDLNEHIQHEGLKKECNFNQPIKFDKVFFSYKEEDEWILKDINLTIQPNTTVAFVGATGAGKSSIVNLLGRFYEFQKGEIFIGKDSIRDLELSYLRKNIAIVLQDVFLFSDTIHNNITLGNHEISREQVILASKAVKAHGFIEKLPGGYDYNVGERGGVLSVGQRQLLAFIRAYVYNPSILILDEATSSVDNEAEELIQQATEELTKGRTSIVIAHRISTIQKANQIVVLDKGEIKEKGTHKELLTLENGYYKRLFDKQFSEQTKNEQ